MKAVVYEKYGSLDVLELREVTKPSITDNQVLIKVHAASIQQTDINFRKGTPLLARLLSGLLAPKNLILGCDYSGTVESVGKNITEYSIGDAVYGQLNKRTGTHAEYIAVSMNELTHKPKNLSHIEAASVGVAGTIALQCLRDYGEIRKGQKVLINGASGGIGTFAVQIAKSYGAEVTGVCSSSNLELVKSLSADHVIDYAVENFTERTNSYDIIFDAVRKSSFNKSKNALTSNGVYVTTEFGPGIILTMKMNPDEGKRMKGMLMNPDIRDLDFLTELIETGKIKPVIDRVYPLEQASEAHQYVEQGHARGKVILESA